jgi:hypothetical protein
MNARGRPQRLQRVYERTLNFGFFLHFSINALRATCAAPNLIVFIACADGNRPAAHKFIAAQRINN